jgi:hypothetical protein
MHLPEQAPLDPLLSNVNNHFQLLCLLLHWPPSIPKLDNTTEHVAVEQYYVTAYVMNIQQLRLSDANRKKSAAGRLVSADPPVGARHVLIYPAAPLPPLAPATRLLRPNCSPLALQQRILLLLPQALLLPLLCSAAWWVHAQQELPSLLSSRGLDACASAVRTGAVRYTISDIVPRWW